MCVCVCVCEGGGGGRGECNYIYSAVKRLTFCILNETRRVCACGEIRSNKTFSILAYPSVPVA